MDVHTLVYALLHIWALFLNSIIAPSLLRAEGPQLSRDPRSPMQSKALAAGPFLRKSIWKHHIHVQLWVGLLQDSRKDDGRETD